MNTNEVVVDAPESVETPDVAEMSLAEYRESRQAASTETPAAADADTEEAPASDDAPAAGDADAEESTDSEESKSDDKTGKPGKKGGFQRTIEKKDREIAELKARLAGPAPAATPATVPAPVPAFEKAKPTLDQFESIEAYTEALSDWKADERDWKKAQASVAQAQQNERKQVVDRWNSGTAEAKKAHADYDKALEAVADIRLSPAHQQLLLESEAGPELAYALAKDRKQLEAIAAMSPIAAAKAIAKLEVAHGSKNPKPDTKTVSTAPRPIRPVSGANATGAGTIDVSRLSNEKYRALRKAGRIR